MQTFLITPNYEQTAALLDQQRLGKQRIETQQVVGILLTELGLPGHNGGYRHHVVNKYWRGYVGALLTYNAAIMAEWVGRGYKNEKCAATHILQVSTARDGGLLEDIRYPVFSELTYRSHRNNLARKWPEFYVPLFERHNLEIDDDYVDRAYVWDPPETYTLEIL